jgi:hypothetical protein
MKPHTHHMLPVSGGGGWLNPTPRVIGLARPYLTRVTYGAGRAAFAAARRLMFPVGRGRFVPEFRLGGGGAGIHETRPDENCPSRARAGDKQVHLIRHRSRRNATSKRMFRSLPPEPAGGRVPKTTWSKTHRGENWFSLRFVCVFRAGPGVPTSGPLTWKTQVASLW